MDEFDQLLVDARASFTASDWYSTHKSLTAAANLGELPLEDLDLLGRSAWWLGETRQSLELSESVFSRLEGDGMFLEAAMKALDIGLLWYIRGDLVIVSGWLSRARRILADVPQGVVHGYLLFLDASVSLTRREFAPARLSASVLRDLGSKLRDPALTSFGLVLSGLADVHTGRTASGFAHLDEAMLPVLAGSVRPEWAGGVYCVVVHACHDVGDLQRMRAWTDATEQWCEQFAGEVVYSGICRIHRLQLESLEGDWNAAEDAIAESGAELIGRNNWVAGEAFYQLGELRRLRGDLAGALEAYDRARGLGHVPQPGESLLQHASGNTDAAWASLRGALAGGDQLASIRLLEPAVDLAIALGLVDDAEQLCSQLENAASTFDTAGFRARAGKARGTVHIARSQFAEALVVLQAAANEYRRLHARYETARVYELLARAHVGLGQPSVAAADTATALAIYRELGAAPDVRRLAPSRAPGGLTDRELHVLELIAAGASNKEAAAILVISEKTVSRHLANIFAKIGVSTRTAAAAWAHEHGVKSRHKLSSASFTP